MYTVSIVITTYKRPVLLIEAVNSCIVQTYPPAEIIIGDDSPDEYTREAVEKIRKTTAIPIKYIHNKPSLKQARNVNMLFDAAKSNYVMLLHDDDLLMPESLEILIGVFKHHPSTKVAYGKQYIIDENGKIDFQSSEEFNDVFYRVKEYEGSVLSPFEASLGQQFPNNGYMIDAKIVKHIQYRLEAGDACDYEFGYQLGLAGHKMYFVNKYLGKYRLLSNSISHSKSSDCAYQSYQILKSSLPNSSFSEKVRAKRLYERAPIAITEAVNLGKRKEALTILTSQWYRNRIFSLRGVKRVLYVLFYFDTDTLIRHIRRLSMKSGSALVRQ